MESVSFEILKTTGICTKLINSLLPQFPKMRVIEALLAKAENLIKTGKISEKRLYYSFQLYLSEVITEITEKFGLEKK